MPDTDDLDFEDDQTTESPAIAALRKEAKQAKKLQEERDALVRENALLKAGLSGLSEKQTKALLATHDGDMTPDAIKATAQELGFTTDAPAPTAEAPEPTTELEALERIGQAAMGAGQHGVPSFIEELEAAKPKGQDAVLEVIARHGRLAEAD